LLTVILAARLDLGELSHHLGGANVLGHGCTLGIEAEARLTLAVG
jgi:hypothetical protein